MSTTYFLHIVAGSLSLIAGYTALYSTKGAPLHRRSGTVFVYAMLTMCFFGAVMAAVRGTAPALNIPAAILTAYLVITAVIVLRSPAPLFRWLDPALMLVALGVGVTTLGFALQAAASPDGTRHGLPAGAFLLFGITGSVAAIGDVRMLWRGRPQGLARIRRHLWRMTFALFIAALSFFIGQANVIPEPIRHRGLLTLPVVAVFVTMVFYLCRTRARRSIRTVAAVPMVEPEVAR